MEQKTWHKRRSRGQTHRKTALAAENIAAGDM
jgi:hypothetical protein